MAIDGDDRAAGTEAAPFATWQRGVDAAAPGDVVPVGDGRYRPAFFARQPVRIARSGTEAAPIVLRAAPGATPTLDCGAMRYDQTSYCLLVEADWWRIEGVVVEGVRQPTATSNSAGILLASTRHVTVERVVSRRHEGKGVVIAGDARFNTLRRVDSHDNADPRTAGGNADGIAATSLVATATGNLIEECRSWSNTDDGFYLWEAEAAIRIDRSWAFRNGYWPGTDRAAGDGDGFKLGRNASGPAHVVTRNLSFANRGRGYNANGASGPVRVLNNTAYANGLAAFSFIEPVAHILRNNVAVGVPVLLDQAVDAAANTWNLGVEIEARDFRSVRDAGVAAARDAGGALPGLAFLRPRPGGFLADRGIPVGLPFVGPAPELGAYELRR